MYRDKIFFDKCQNVCNSYMINFGDCYPTYLSKITIVKLDSKRCDAFCYGKRIQIKGLE